jgi:hypothetical protein
VLGPDQEAHKEVVDLTGIEPALLSKFSKISDAIHELFQRYDRLGTLRVVVSMQHQLTVRGMRQNRWINTHLEPI